MEKDVASCQRGPCGFGTLRQEKAPVAHEYFGTVVSTGYQMLVSSLPSARQSLWGSQASFAQGQTHNEVLRTYLALRLWSGRLAFSTME